MNLVIIRGNLVKDVELKKFNSGKFMASFCVAVKRDLKNADGGYDSDFISCKAFGNTAEMISKYFHKGSGIIVEGHIQTGSYEGQDGKKVYTFDVMVNKIHFDRNNSIKKEEEKEMPKEEKKEQNNPFEEFGKKLENNMAEEWPW